MCMKFLRCLWFENRAKVSLLVVRNGTNQHKHVKPTRMETLIQSTDVRKKQNIAHSLIFLTMTSQLIDIIQNNKYNLSFLHSIEVLNVTKGENGFTTACTHVTITNVV